MTFSDSASHTFVGILDKTKYYIYLTFLTMSYSLQRNIFFALTLIVKDLYKSISEI